MSLLKAGGLDARDRVGGVAVGADRRLGGALGEQFAVHGGLVEIDDADVTLAAGRGDVGAIDRGLGRLGGECIVGPVAIRTGRGDGQSGLAHRAAVNRFEVEADLFLAVETGGRCADMLGVAIAADLDDIERESARAVIGLGENVMCAMAGGAGRGILVALRGGGGVSALQVRVGLLGVAGGGAAGGRGKGLGVGQVLGGGVTTDAGEFGVTGAGEDFAEGVETGAFGGSVEVGTGGVDHFAALGGGQFGDAAFAVAVEAAAVFNFSFGVLRGAGGTSQKKEHEKEADQRNRAGHREEVSVPNCPDRMSAHNHIWTKASPVPRECDLRG